MPPRRRRHLRAVDESMHGRAMNVAQAHQRFRAEHPISHDRPEAQQHAAEHMRDGQQAHQRQEQSQISGGMPRKPVADAQQREGVMRQARTVDANRRQRQTGDEISKALGALASKRIAGHHMTAAQAISRRGSDTSRARIASKYGIDLSNYRLPGLPKASFGDPRRGSGGPKPTPMPVRSGMPPDRPHAPGPSSPLEQLAQQRRRRGRPQPPRPSTGPRGGIVNY